MSKTPVWSWRHAVAKAAVPTLTKALCWAIANYLSDAGKGCWPSMQALVEDSGMCERSITTHLKIASDAGLLHARRFRDKRGHLGPYKYHPGFPNNMELQQIIPASEGGIPAPDEDGHDDHEPGAPDASRDASLGALGSKPRRTKCATSNISKEELSKRERALASEASLLEATWTLPDEWRAWATKEGPEHAHMIDNEARKFRSHWRATAKADWEGEWQKWFLRTMERPPVKATSPTAAISGGVTLRDTGEPIPLMLARSIVAGTYKGPILPKWREAVERHVAELSKVSA